ncbi:MAG: ABC transporter permease [Gemmatimonadetes bacterium]|nr:ABC transporter permease [Gemmatimonadota bacterium]
MKPVEGWRPMRRDHADLAGDVNTELQAHIEGRVEEYMSVGMSAQDARTKAESQFGDIGQIAAACRREGRGRHERTTPEGRDFMQSILQDVRFAIRTLIKRPAFAATVLLTVVLSIGATTAMFSVVNGVLLHPLPHPDPEELVLVYEVDQRGRFLEDHNSVTQAGFDAWRRQNRVFESMAAFQMFPLTFRGEGDPEKVSAGSVTPAFFGILGLNAVVGRTFLPEEEQPGTARVVILGHMFWQRRYGGDPAVVGTTVGVGSGSYEIVGVLPPGFEFLDQDIALWIPRRLSQDALQNWRSHTLNVVARLREGVTLDQAQADMERVVDALRQEQPAFLTGWSVNVVSMTDEVVGNIRPALFVLLGAVGIVLLIATVNVANLMLARMTAEQREFAVRTALGAVRSRLVRQKLTESLVLAVAGGAAGVLVAIGATRLLLTVAPESLPHVDQIAVDGRVLAFAALMSLLTGFVFGIVPALHSSRPDVAGFLKEGSRSTTGTRAQHRLRTGFAVSQLAFSLVLLISAGLMMSTFLRLMRVDPGFHAAGVMTMKVTLPRSRYPDVAAQAAFLDQLIPELRRAPDVQYAGATKFLPFGDDEWTWSVQIDGQPVEQEGEKRDYGYHLINAEYFPAMGITLERGRAFNQFDALDAPLVAIVNQSFVRRFFADGTDPIGQRMAISGSGERWIEIVGLVEDVNQYSLDIDPEPAYYAPYGQALYPWLIDEMNLVLHTAGDPTATVSRVRRAVRTLDPQVVVSDVATMHERVSKSVARSRFALILLGVFAGVALTLALVGIYGVISYSVGQRAQEIGLRIALGAEPMHIVAQILKSGAWLATAGIAVGLVFAAAFTRFQASLLYGVEAIDPLVYGTLAVVLGLVTLLATYVPARRASRLDPMAVLREE